MHQIKKIAEKLKISGRDVIRLCVITVIFVLAYLLVFHTTIETRMIRTRIEKAIAAEDHLVMKLSEDVSYRQSFTYESGELLSAGVQVYLDENERNHQLANEKNYDLGVLHLELSDNDSNVLAAVDYNVYELDDEQHLMVSLPQRQGGFLGQTLTLSIQGENLHEPLELGVSYTTKKIQGASLTIDGKKQKENFAVQTAGHQLMYWQRWSKIGALLLYFLIAGDYLLLAVYRRKPEQVFLFTGTILAVVYLFLIPPMAVPDENAHFKEAYHFVNECMGKTQGEGMVLMDKEDIRALKKFEATPTLTEYDVIKEELFLPANRGEEKEVERFNTQAPMITYLPGMIGIVLGKALNLNGLQLIYLGRIFSILCYVVTMYLFIRLMPFGKAAAFVMAILPMTIQQCCSYSYDSIVIEVAFLYLAILFRLLYINKTIEKWEILLYAFFMIMLAITKGGAYMPLCLLTMMIPAARFTSTKKKWIFVGVMAAIAIVSFLTGTLSYALYVASPTEEQAAASYMAGKAIGLSGLLADPMKYLQVSLRTIFWSGDGFIETMLGMQLSWLNVFVSRIVIYGMILLMLLSVCRVEGEEDGLLDVNVSVGQKWFYVFVSFCCINMVLASMYMSWTPENALEIAGVQGRYFLPVLPVFWIIFRGKNVILKRNRDRRMIFLAVCLQLVAIYGILMSLETKL